MTIAEEKYLKAIFKIAQYRGVPVGTSLIADELATTPASVSDMLKKLSEKSLIDYEKYYGAQLTESGTRVATDLIRKHRLWETFLVEKLHFEWTEIHEIAEQLEHIRSQTLVERLDEFLDHPRFDPHGEPIPDVNGKFTVRQQVLLRDLSQGERGVVIGVQQQRNDFLRFLDEMHIKLGSLLVVKSVYDFDHSLKVIIDERHDAVISQAISKNIYVRKM